MTALVTGGSSGIGLAFARRLHAAGYDLVLVSNRPDELERAAAGLSAGNSLPHVSTLCVDLSLVGAAQVVSRWCEEQDIVPDVLVNDAGMFFMEYLGPGNLGKVRTMMALHMNAPTELCILLGDRMKERGSGRILNVSSMTARIPAPGIAIYSATKAYLKVFGKSLSHELAPYGVSVTTLCPAAVDTDLYPLGPRLRKILRSLGIIRTPDALARRAIGAMFRGRRVISPGLMNTLLPPLIAIMPNRLIDRLGRKWMGQ